MNRITPQDVVDAYIATGMYRTPMQFIDGKGGGCALCVLAISQGHHITIDNASTSHFAKVLGLDRQGYLLDFQFGFEVGIDCGNHKNHIAVGDGIAAREAVLSHFAKPEPEAAEVDSVGEWPANTQEQECNGR